MISKTIAGILEHLTYPKCRLSRTKLRRLNFFLLSSTSYVGQVTRIFRSSQMKFQDWLEPILHQIEVRSDVSDWLETTTECFDWV
jgi:hypothetical protein